MNGIRRFLKDEGGQDLIEHTLLVGFLLFIIIILTTGNTSVSAMWGSANNQLSNAVLSTS